MQSFQGIVNQLSPFQQRLGYCLTAFTTAAEETANVLNKTEENTLVFQKAKDNLTSDKEIAYFRPGPPAALYRRKFEERSGISLEATAI